MNPVSPESLDYILSFKFQGGTTYYPYESDDPDPEGLPLFFLPDGILSKGPDAGSRRNLGDERTFLEADPVTLLPSALYGIVKK